MIEVGRTYNIVDVPQNVPCENCKLCLRLRMMEMGLYPGEKILINNNSLGMWIVSILGSADNIVTTLALREEEFNRMCLKLI